MPIRPLLANSKLPPAQQDLLVLAFNDTLRKLSLVDRSDPICEIVARKVIEIGSRGAMSAVAITEIACKELGPGRR
jgi:hypothetical protein